MAPTKPRKSELWQRLRAARDYGKKTQLDIARGLGLTRGAVALWEARGPEIRTNPTADQIMAVAAMTGVPADYILDDNQRPDDVFSFMQHRKDVVDSTPTPKAQQASAQGAAFWSAVKYEALRKNAGLSRCFDQPVQLHHTELRAGYLQGKTLAQFVANGGDFRDLLVQEVKNMLIIELALGRRCTKSVFIWSPDETPPAKLAPLMALGKTLDVQVKVCHDPIKAARAVLSL